MGLPQIHTFTHFLTLVAALTTLQKVASTTTSACHSSTTILAAPITPLMLTSQGGRTQDRLLHNPVCCVMRGTCPL